MVIIVRHPLWVVASRIQLGWRDHLGQLLENEFLVEDHLQPQYDRLLALDDPVSRMIAQWAIETVVPLRTLDGGRACFVSYERLRQHTTQESERVLRYLGQTVDEALVTVAAKPSRTSREGSPSADGLLPAWSAILSSKQVEKAAEIINLFGLDRIYAMDQPLPCSDTLDGMV